MKYSRKENVWSGIEPAYGVDYNKSGVVVKERKCDHCGEMFTRYELEIDYVLKIGNRKFEFCSWDCKCKFKREHSEELEMEKNESLDAYDKIKKNERKTNERRKINTLKFGPLDIRLTCYVDGVEYPSISKASRAVFGKANYINYVRKRGNKNEFDLDGHHIKVEVNDNE